MIGREEGRQTDKNGISVTVAFAELQSIDGFPAPTLLLVILHMGSSSSPLLVPRGSGPDSSIVTSRIRQRAGSECRVFAKR